MRNVAASHRFLAASCLAGLISCVTTVKKKSSQSEVTKESESVTVEAHPESAQPADPEGYKQIAQRAKQNVEKQFDVDGHVESATH